MANTEEVIIEEEVAEQEEGESKSRDLFIIIACLGYAGCWGYFELLKHQPFLETSGAIILIAMLLVAAKFIKLARWLIIAITYLLIISAIIGGIGLLIAWLSYGTEFVYNFYLTLFPPQSQFSMWPFITLFALVVACFYIKLQWPETKGFLKGWNDIIITIPVVIIVNAVVWNVWVWLLSGVVISTIVLITFGEILRKQNRAFAGKVITVFVIAFFSAIAYFGEYWLLIVVAFLPSSPIGIITAGLGAVTMGVPLANKIKSMLHND